MRGQFVEVVKLFREEFRAGHPRDKVHDVVAEMDHQPPQQRPDAAADHPDQEPLQYENPRHRPVPRAERLQQPDLTGLLVDRGHQRIGDAERRHQHDEDQQEEHHPLLHRQHAQQLFVLVLPGGDPVAAELFSQGFDKLLLLERVRPPAEDAGRTAPRQVEKFGRVVDSDEEHAPVEVIFADRVDAGHGELRGQIGGTVRIDLHAAIRLEPDQTGQPLRRVQQNLVAHLHPPARRHVGADDRLVLLQRKHSPPERGVEFKVFAQLLRPGAEEEQLHVELAPPLHQHRRLNHRRRVAARRPDRLDDLRRVADHPPPRVAHLKMRLRLHQLLLHEVGESGHHRQHHHQHRHAERHAEHARKRDQRHRVPLGLQIAPGQKKFRQHIQSIVCQAGNISTGETKRKGAAEVFRKKPQCDSVRSPAGSEMECEWFAERGAGSLAGNTSSPQGALRLRRVGCPILVEARPVNHSFRRKQK